MWCLTVCIVHPFCPEISNKIHFFSTKKEAEEKLNFYKDRYNRYYDLGASSIEEFDEMLANGVVREQVYNNFKMNNDPFAYKVFEVQLD